MTTSVQTYLTSIPPDRQALITTLHDLILELYPEAVVDMQYKMPTYHRGDGWVALANQKHYVSLYTCGAHHLVEFKAKHPKIKTGKGCINFKVSDVLPLEEIKTVVRHAMENPKGSSKD